MNVMRIDRAGGDRVGARRAVGVRVLGVVAALVMGSAAMGQSLTLLGNPAGYKRTNPLGISDDGRVITGRSDDKTPYANFVAVDDVRTDLSLPTGLSVFYSNDVSGDGRYLAFQARRNPNSLAQGGIYKVSDGTYSLINSDFGSGWRSTAVATSRDAGIVAGYSVSSNGLLYQSWYWTGQGDAIAIPSGNRGGFATDISSDGRFICGNERPPGVAGSPFIYDRVTNTYTSLDQRIGDAYAISGDGRVVVGSAIDTRGWYRPAKWENGAMQFLTDGYANQGDFVAVDASFDGSVITCETLPFFNGGPLSFIWTQSGGFVESRQFFASYGVIVPNQYIIAAAISVSADGRTFTGTAYDGTIAQPFVITIPGAGGGSLAVGLLMAVGTRRRR
jgi:uncharacterized membrane protein